MKTVAALARLRLDSDGIAAMKKELGDILKHVSVLSQVNTDEVGPTFITHANFAVLRSDKEEASLKQDVVLGAAPAIEMEGVKVPKVMEE